MRKLRVFSQGKKLPQAQWLVNGWFWSRTQTFWFKRQHLMVKCTASGNTCPGSNSGSAAPWLYDPAKDSLLFPQPPVRLLCGLHVFVNVKHYSITLGTRCALWHVFIIPEPMLFTVVFLSSWCLAAGREARSMDRPLPHIVLRLRQKRREQMEGAGSLKSRFGLSGNASLSKWHPRKGQEECELAMGVGTCA